MRRVIICAMTLVMLAQQSYAQSSYYTVLQATGTLGVKNPGYKGAFSGYALHFIFGKNFNERFFAGVGLGSGALKGEYRIDDPMEPAHQYDRYLFPLFADFRWPLVETAGYARLGLLANVGYAPKIGPVYDRGGLAKAGVLYLYDSPKRAKLTISATYGWQQLRGNFYGSNFNHQQVSLSVGMMLK